ncbi:MAG TPA: ABC transporter ATP-binding protein [Candidatus Sumerlaeota bacterium]|nr:ABC transporter ATP-binding protein [Candidatus Sumerlaeota bacterium]
MTQDSAAIKISGLTRRFGDITAVDRLSLHISGGSILGFLGPNGAGKTTTIRLLLGLLRPDEGCAEIHGMDCSRDADSVREICGALLEYPGLYENLTAIQNMEYFADIYGLRSGEKDSRVRELLTFVDLLERSGEKVRGWSRGMKQKLSLARSLIHSPRVLFLDEPTLGLDVASARKIRDIIRKLAAESRTTIFFTSHNLDEVEQICTNVAIIRKGRLVTQGRPEDLRKGRNTRVLSIRTGGIPDGIVEKIRILQGVERAEIEGPNHSDSREPGALLVIHLKPEQDISECLAALVQSGITINDIQTMRPTLESVFLELTENDPTTENTF